jgi:phosphohistidine swiveling domain-containing protein
MSNSIASIKHFENKLKRLIIISNMKNIINFERQWEQDHSPLLWVEMVDYGDYHQMKKYLGFNFGGHYFVSHNQTTAFYKNSKVAKAAKKFGQKKYSDVRFIKNLCKTIKKMEKDSRSFSLSIKTSDLRFKNNFELERIFKEFFSRNALIYAYFRFSRPDFYQDVLDKLKKKYGFLSDADFSKLLSNLEEKRIVKKDKELLSALKMVGDARFSMHNTWEFAYRKGNPLFKEIGQRAGLSVLQIQNCTSAEISNLLKGKKIDERKINNRISSFKFVSSNNKKFNVLSPFKEEKKVEVVPDMIKGAVAYGGIVRGRVYLISESLRGTQKELIAGMPKNGILVTVMTAPDMVPAMRRAAAIITDEGGLLCHAAIVARELKKPCIISTGRATKILKPGDLVEVDANKGIIIKL